MEGDFRPLIAEEEGVQKDKTISPTKMLTKWVLDTPKIMVPPI